MPSDGPNGIPDPHVPNPTPEQTLTGTEARLCHLHRQALMQHEICRITGLAPSTVSETLHKAWRKIAAYNRFEAEQSRQIQFDRLDMMLRVALEIATDPNRGDKIRLEAMDRVLNNEIRRAKLLGLDESHRIAEEERPTDPHILAEQIRERVRKAREAERAKHPSEN
jgi:hypothetical protein